MLMCFSRNYRTSTALQVHVEISNWEFGAYIITNHGMIR